MKEVLPGDVVFLCRKATIAAVGRIKEDGVYPSRAALARAEGVSRAAVTQGLGRC